jgi:histidinol phosphatase-like enzyme
MIKRKVIAIDLDGVMWEEDFPNIHGLMEGAKETILDLYAAGYILVIWTARTNTYKDADGNPGMYLEKAKAFLEQEGILHCFAATNENVKAGCDCRKVLADYYIDDRNLGGFPGWQWVRDLLLSEEYLGVVPIE